MMKEAVTLHTKLSAMESEIKQNYASTLLKNLINICSVSSNELTLITQEITPTSFESMMKGAVTVHTKQSAMESEIKQNNGSTLIKYLIV